MGLQNAVITKISKAEIRTTHVTGLVTDIGIELGKLAYWNRHAHPGEAPVQANFERLALFSRLVISFFSGGVLGAWGLKHLGYLSTLPLALLLVLLVITPVSDDIRARLRRETV